MTADYAAQDIAILSSDEDTSRVSKPRTRMKAMARVTLRSVASPARKRMFFDHVASKSKTCLRTSQYLEQTLWNLLSRIPLYQGTMPS